VLRYPDARTRPLLLSAIQCRSVQRAVVGARIPGEDEGLPVHDGRILLGGVLGLRVGAAMATVDGGHGVPVVKRGCCRQRLHSL
jgi:hypothetical protein